MPAFLVALACVHAVPSSGTCLACRDASVCLHMHAGWMCAQRLACMLMLRCPGRLPACLSLQACIMAVGGSRSVAVMKDGQPASKSQMTVTLSGGWLGGWVARAARRVRSCRALWRMHAPRLCFPDSLHESLPLLPSMPSALPLMAHSPPPLLLPFFSLSLFPGAADQRVYDGEVASQFLEAFSRHISNPYRLFQ